MTKSLSFAGQALGVGLLLGLAGTAHAHINMLAPLLGRGGDQKADPCEGQPRGTVYTFEPGALITLGVNESLAHDSYYRIAFDDDGQDGFKNPASIDPINDARLEGAPPFSAARAGFPKCLADTTDQCGKSDFCNVVSKTGGPTVLWDNIDPHLAAVAQKKPTWQWTIQLPDVECDNCTIQVIQVMEDIAGVFHGPFDNRGDLYYRCIDIVLKKGAGKTGPGNATGPVSANGIDCTKAEMTDAGVMLPDSGVVVYTDAGAPPVANPGSDAGVVQGPFDAGNVTGAVGDAAAGGPGAGPVPPADSDDGCSVHAGADRARDSLVGLGFLALGLVVRRVRGRKSR